MHRLLSRTRLVLGVAALASLLLATAADGRVRKLSGGVKGDPNAKVSMKVVKRRGKPRKVKKFRFKNLDHRCGLTTREFDGKLPGKSRIDRVGITRRYTFFEFVMFPSGVHAPNDQNNITATGQMRRNAKKVKGTIGSTINLEPVPPAISNTCVADAHKYTARR